MVRKCIFSILLLFISVSFSAQTADRNLAVGLNFVKNEYNGDYGNGIFDFKQPAYGGIGISLTKYLTHSFDLGLQGSYGSYGYIESDVNRFSGSKFDASLFIHYKLNNGYLLEKESKLAPFFSFGFGLATYGTINSAAPYPTIITKGIDLIIPFGAGLKYQLTQSISIQYQYLYNITNSDVHDQNRSGGIVNTFFGTPAYPHIKPGNDAYGEHIIGLVFNFKSPEILRGSNNCKCTY